MRPQLRMGQSLSRLFAGCTVKRQLRQKTDINAHRTGPHHG
jgi:hypothetical protein